HLDRSEAEWRDLLLLLPMRLANHHRVPHSSRLYRDEWAIARSATAPAHLTLPQGGAAATRVGHPPTPPPQTSPDSAAGQRPPHSVPPCNTQTSAAAPPRTSAACTRWFLPL